MKQAGLIYTTWKQFYKHPFLILPLTIFLVFFIWFSKLSVTINHTLTNNFTLILWLTLFTLIILAVLAFLGSVLISYIKEIQSIKKKINFKSLFSNAIKSTPHVFFIIIIIHLSFIALGIVATALAFFIGKIFNLPIAPAQFLFYLFYVTGLLSTFIFATYAVNITVLTNSSVFTSLKVSIKKVKENYLETLAILIIFFLISAFFEDYLLYSIGGSTLGTYLNHLFIYPLFFLFLTKYLERK